jgi:hypothetical protein
MTPTPPRITFAAMLVRAQRRFAALSRPLPSGERGLPGFLHAARQALPAAK